MPIADLAAIARALPLPDGARLVFVPVTEAEGQLPEEARQWATRRRNGFAAGRRAAAEALLAAGYPDRIDLPIGADRLPVWPEGWHGSISHTDSVAAAVVAPAPQLIGLDVETVMTPDTAQMVREAIIPEDTRSDMTAETVTRIFSAKEALYKALYPAIRQFKDFDAARVEAFESHGDVCRLTLSLTEDWGSDRPAGATFEAYQVSAAGHVVSLLWA